MPNTVNSAAREPMSRRAVLRTAAWSAPVIAVAVAAPAAAASTSPRAPSPTKLNLNSWTVSPNGAVALTQVQVNIAYSATWPAIVAVRATLRYPKSTFTAGTYSSSGSASGWAAASAPVSSGDDWVVTSDYSGVLNPAGQRDTGILRIAAPLLLTHSAVTPNPSAMRYAGGTVFVTVVGTDVNGLQTQLDPNSAKERTLTATDPYWL